MYRNDTVEGCPCQYVLAHLNIDVVAVHIRPADPQLCSAPVPLRYGPIPSRMGMIHSHSMY